MKIFSKLCLIVCLIIALICSLSGCENSSVTSEQLQKDLNLCNEIQECFYSEHAGNSRYQVIECTITGTEVDENEIENIVFCNAKAKNDDFELQLDVKAVYQRYDNDWVLNEVSCDLDDVKALNEPNIEELRAIIENQINSKNRFSYGVPDDDGNGMRYYYLYSEDNDFSIIDAQVNENGKSANINCCYRSDNAKYYGYYKLDFDKTGWHFNTKKDIEHMTLTKYDFDFSNEAIGKFYHSYEDEYASLIVHKIENGIVSYSLQGNDSILINCEFELGDNLTAEFDITKGEFLGLHYSSEEDLWEFGALELKRQ